MYAREDGSATWPHTPRVFFAPSTANPPPRPAPHASPAVWRGRAARVRAARHLLARGLVLLSPRVEVVVVVEVAAVE
jgi:hypothetical protein